MVYYVYGLLMSTVRTRVCSYSYGDEFNNFFLDFGKLYTFFIIIINKNVHGNIDIQVLFAKIHRELNSDEKVILSNTQTHVYVNNFSFHL